jgi:hypothetical protein
MRMKRCLLIVALVLSLAFSIMATAFAEGSTSSWPFFAEVHPAAQNSGLYSLAVPLEVLNRAREDLADLRLYDSAGREIPYALWIRKEVDDVREVDGRLFNQVSAGANATEVSVDLGQADPGEHNQIEIETSGMNFRRRVEIEGSDAANDWKKLTSDLIFSFKSSNDVAQSNRVSYPTSRYRYLRVRVFADEQVDKQPPAITNVKVSLAVRQKGERVDWHIGLPAYELLRRDGAPASSWTLDLGGRVPCDRLLLDASSDSFSRPFQLEAIDDPDNIRLLATGQLVRHVGEEKRPLVIAFDQEEYVRKLRLVVTDYANQSLPVYSFTASAPMRQMIFELKGGAGWPLRLYFGNPKAGAPHYDFERDLPARMQGLIGQVSTGALVTNPDFKPEPLPLTERVPWLIYVVLTASSLALAFVLFRLARATMRAHEEAAPEVPAASE